MKVEFINKHLKTLYVEGKSKKYKLDAQIIQKFFQRVAILEAADSISDLWKTPSLNFEHLEGGGEHYSVRLNRQYRLEMEIDWENEKRVLGIIGLTDISNHYGD